MLYMAWEAELSLHGDVQSQAPLFRQREKSARNVLAILVPCLRFCLLPLLLPLPKYLQYTLTPRPCIVKGIKAPTVLNLRIRALLKAPSKSATEIAQIETI